MTTPLLTTAHSWAPITKREKQADGTLLVSGPVADSGLDRDLQICDPTWLDKALPDWFTESANIREMHTSNAVGKGLSYNPETREVVAHLVDPVTVLKAETEVLNGFSIGIKRPQVVADPNAPGGRIIGGTICEVSVVDRPSNPRTLFTMAKADDAGTLIPVVDPILATVESQQEAQGVEGVQAMTAALLSSEDGLQARWDSLVARAGSNSVIPGNKAEEADQGKALQGAGLDVFRSVAAMLLKEAEDLANGDLSEGWDVTLLLDVLTCLQRFLSSEIAEDEADEGSVEASVDTDAAEVTDDAAANLPRDEMPGGVAEPFVSLSENPDLTKDDGPSDEDREAHGVDLGGDKKAYPIANVGQLKDAIQAYGRANPDDRAKVKAHIISRAKALGQSNLIPDEWKTDTAELVKNLLSDEATVDMLKKALNVEALTEANEALTKRLAKLEGTPVPGGPVRMRTSADLAKADQTDRTALEAEADAWQKKADGTDDPILAKGYLNNAAAARERATRR